MLGFGFGIIPVLELNIASGDPASLVSNILLETGDNLLLEGGSFILTE